MSTRRSSVESASSHCSSHNRPLIVFCVECGESLCDSCLSSGAHHRHSYSSLPDACKKKMKVLMKKSKELETNIRKQGHFVSQASNNKRLDVIDDIFTKSKEKIEAMFKELKQMLEANEKQAFKLLDAQQERLRENLTQIELNGEKVRQEIADIQREMEQTGQDAEGFYSVLQECMEQETRVASIDMFLVDWEKNSAFNTFARLKSLENSVNAILEKSKSCLPCPWEFADVITFDRNTAHKMLRVLECDRQVTLPANSLSATHQPINHQDTPLRVLAAQSFNSGKHYWEVDVRGCQGWAVGVVEETSQQRNSKQSWMLELCAGELLALHNDDTNTVRERDLSLIGVFLDFDKGRLQFYNVENGLDLYTFAVRRGMEMRPVFSIIPKDSESSCLVLCDLL